MSMKEEEFQCAYKTSTLIIEYKIEKMHREALREHENSFYRLQSAFKVTRL